MLLLVIFSLSSQVVAQDYPELVKLQLSCAGKSIKEMTLASQLGPHKVQKGGTCAAYSAVASMEAALFRQSGKIHNLSEEFAFLNYCTKRGADRISVWIDKQREVSPVKRDYLDFLSGAHTEDLIDDLLAYEKIPWADASDKSKLTDAQAKMSKVLLSNDIERKQKELKLVDLQLEKDQLEADPSSDSKTKKVEELEKQITKIQYELSNPSYLDRRSICTTASCAKDEMIDKEGRKFALLKNLERVSYSFEKTATTDCKTQKSAKRRIELIEEMLCAGVPVSASMQENATHMYYSKLLAEWTAVDAEEVKDGAKHAFLLVGTKEIAGKPHFVFRNTWEDSPDYAIPFSNVCSIYAIHGVFNTQPIAGEAQSEFEAYYKSDESLYEKRKQSGWIKE